MPLVRLGPGPGVTQSQLLVQPVCRVQCTRPSSASVSQLPWLPWFLCLRWLPVHPSAGPFLPGLAAVSPWRRALPAAEHPWLTTSSAAFVFPAFVSRLALAAGQARHPFQSSLCFIGAVAAQKSMGFNQGENTVFPRSPPSPSRAAVAQQSWRDHIAWQRAAGWGCASGHTSDGQEQVGADVFLLSPSPSIADISFHSQTCHFQHSPVLEA